MYRGDFLFLEKGILSHQQMTQFVVSMFRYVYIELYIYIYYVCSFKRDIFLCTMVNHN